MVAWVARTYRVLPSAAARELAENPWVWDVISADSYRRAYHQIEDWDALPADRRRDVAAPAGPMARLVRANERALALRDMEKRKKALEQAGRA